MAHSPQISIRQLRQLEPFAGLADEVIEAIVASGALRTLPAQGRLSALERKGGESYCFVLVGVLAIAAEPKNSLPKDKRVNKRAGSERSFLGYFDAGTCFSTAFLFGPEGQSGIKIDCVAANSVSLLEVESARLVEFFLRVPSWKSKVIEVLGRSRSLFMVHQEPSRRLVQDFFLRENYITSSVVRVGRTDRCLDCDKCYDACAARHGVARMQRIGPTLGRLTFPIVCRHCDEQPCVKACKFNAVDFDAARGEVKIAASCVGCGLCARNCPNDAITMVAQGPLPEGESSRGPRKRAVKCDHCAGYADRACMTACPTGALIEVSPDQLFRQLEPDPISMSRPFSEVPFLQGIEAQSNASSRWSRLSSVGMIATFVLLSALGIEAFLIRTQPELSLLSYYVRASGSRFPVSYTSGRGIGHWFGYIGTGFMLASVAYSLRTRVKRFRNWGSQNLWLSAHLWFGFVGAVLVTYHSAMKLDRWASIACYLMWLVIVTGAVGRYLFGWVHSTANLVDFERAALREQCEKYAQSCSTKGAIGLLLGPKSGERAKRWTIHVMLWEQLRDFVALGIVYFWGTKALGSRRERLEMIHCLSSWSRHRRYQHYCESAKPLLKHWNLAHIVLAIAMFILAAIHVVYGFLYKAV